MLVTLNRVPEGFTGTKHRFTNYGYLHTSYEELRNAGLQFENGEDEIGHYDQAIAAVAEALFILHRYTNPPDESFAIQFSDREDGQTRTISQAIPYLIALIEKLNLDFSVWQTEPSAVKRKATKGVAAPQTSEGAAGESDAARASQEEHPFSSNVWVGGLNFPGRSLESTTTDFSPRAFAGSLPTTRVIAATKVPRTSQEKKAKES